MSPKVKRRQVLWSAPVVASVVVAPSASASPLNLKINWAKVTPFAQTQEKFAVSEIVVLDSANVPVAHVNVTFTITGALASFSSGSSLTVTTDATGHAFMGGNGTSALAAGLNQGAFSIVASAVQGQTTVTSLPQNFIIENNVAAATPLAQSVINSAMDQINTMRTSSYEHVTDVNVATGKFDYDCSGFGDYTVSGVSQAAYSELPISQPSRGRPLADDWLHHIQHVGPAGIGHWKQIVRIDELLPGDIVTWTIPPYETSPDTGHVMIVKHPPVADPDIAGAYRVRVIDSSVAHHRADTRRSNENGLGSGEIGLQSDAQGECTGFYWQGGVLPYKPDTVVFGRPA